MFGLAKAPSEKKVQTSVQDAAAQVASSLQRIHEAFVGIAKSVLNSAKTDQAALFDDGKIQATVEGGKRIVQALNTVKTAMTQPSSTVRSEKAAVLAEVPAPTAPRSFGPGG